MVKKPFTDPFPTLGRKRLFAEKEPEVVDTLRYSQSTGEFALLGKDAAAARDKPKAGRVKKPARMKVSRRSKGTAKARVAKDRSSTAARASSKKSKKRGKGRPETTGKPWLAKGAKFTSRSRWYLARKEGRL